MTLPETTMTRNVFLLQVYGPGMRPCLDGANNWLGCTSCALPCILSPRSKPRQQPMVTAKPPAKKSRKEQSWWRVGSVGHKRRQPKAR